jgi:HEXXH motif-containing protein
LHGVLLAVHAFLPVARFYERLAETNQVLSRRADFQARFEEIRRINREGAALLLEHARPTRVGAGVLDEIRRWGDHFR